MIFPILQRQALCPKRLLFRDRHVTALWVGCLGNYARAATLRLERQLGLGEVAVACSRAAALGLGQRKREAARAAQAGGSLGGTGGGG